MKIHVETIKEMHDKCLNEEHWDSGQELCSMCEEEIKGYISAVKSELEFLNVIDDDYSITCSHCSEAVSKRISDCEDAIALAGRG